MREIQPEQITRWLQAAREGDTQSIDALFSVVYEQLRHLAHKVRAGEPGQTMNTTALVHEAYVKLHLSSEVEMENRLHFYRIAARAMRQVLVEVARRKKAQKRGAGRMAVTFDELMGVKSEQADDVLALEEAIKALEAMNPRHARVVECRFFAGLTVEETADVLGISTPTVKRDWRTARAWLAMHINA
jgi:RNA polymerase sigma factor (TIGR02999 family)